MIKKSKSKEEKPDFDDVLNEVEYEIEGQDAEQVIIDCVPELKALSTNIDKATSTYINAALQLESAIQQYQRAESKLDGAVDTISKKVDTINTHIDNALKDAPTKLKVTASVSDASKKAIQEMFDNEHKWILGKMQVQYQEINSMIGDEFRIAQKRYKEYDGCYLGHYIQYLFFFFFIGLLVVVYIIVMAFAKYNS